MGMESAHKDENKRKGRGGENHMHKSEVYLCHPKKVWGKKNRMRL